MDNIYDSEKEARTKLDSLEETQMKTHHTYLDIISFDGNVQEELTKLGVIY
ncbi:hypothetical protein [Roseovarius sp. 2305UL8-3]|uniref:hypothetical protein n=1 Tax=Roseovarius conchicola TaxID=3121636 RepID=UPI0035275644